MAVEPKDTNELVALLAFAKSSWQWFLATAIAIGTAGWKYLNRRFEKSEMRYDAIHIEMMNKLVTGQQMSEHTRLEDEKFKVLFEDGRKRSGQLETLITEVKLIGVHMKSIDGRMYMVEEATRELQVSVTRIDEKHRIEEIK